MFRKKFPDKERVNKCIAQFPHCDQRILHAPGECKFCDEHSEWQALRIAWDIAFTNYEPEGTELPCPANYARGDKCSLWFGNAAKPKSRQVE